MAKYKSIRGEIRSLVVTAVMLALAITFLFNAIYKISTEYSEAEIELQVLAQVTAINSQSALMFDDKVAAEEILNALAPRTDIIYAEIVTAAGETLAKLNFNQYQSDAYGLVRQFSQFVNRALGNEAIISVTQEVKLNGHMLGVVKLNVDNAPIWTEILYALVGSILAMLFAIVSSVFLVRKRINNMMRPIILLSTSAANIAKTGQYSQRVTRLFDDEFGLMTDQFNLMLSEIEKRDQAQMNQNALLEQEVEKRTRDISGEMQKMQSLLDSMAEAAYGVDVEGNCKFVNLSFLRILGYDHADELIGRNIYSLIHHSQEDGTPHPLAECKIYKASTINGASHGVDEVFWRKDGVAIPVEYWSRPLIIDGVAQGAITTFVDISKRKIAETELKIAAVAFDSQQSMIVMDDKHQILRVNRAFAEVTGYSAEEVIGKYAGMFRAGLEDEDFYIAMWESINATDSWQGEIWNKRKNGEVYPGRVSISAVRNHNGIVTNYVSMLTDITTSKAAEQEIKSLAFYDSLTALPNRRLLLDRLGQALSYSARSGRTGALLFIDLDHFKTLNDTLGHGTGDVMLQQVASRLSASVREGDTVSRFGGDEFVVVLEDLSEHAVEAATQTEVVADKILFAINQPYFFGSSEHHSTSSIGATLFNDHLTGIDELLKQADIAMYQAKKAGRNTLRFFDPQMQETINTHASLEAELRKALERHQFLLYYQLQVDGKGQPLGAEVLIRWQHPERGLISPLHFIPLAEETGLIIPIGNWVLDAACAQIKAWQSKPVAQQLTLSVNVSAKQFRQTDFVEQVQSAVERNAINPTHLKLELTESILLEQVDITITTMNALKDIGVRFSLDDFGTGYSSLQYLKKLPLYQLKIDQSFVRDIADDLSDQAIVRTIIAMAQTLNLNVIAEGVETEQQHILLQNNGCNTFQGYLFARPVAIDEFEERLLQNIVC